MFKCCGILNASTNRNSSKEWTFCYARSLRTKHDINDAVDLDAIVCTLFYIW